MDVNRNVLAYEIVNRKMNNFFEKDFEIKDCNENDKFQEDDQVSFFLSLKYFFDEYNRIIPDTLLKQKIKDIYLQKYNLLRKIIIDSKFKPPDLF